MPLTGVFSQCKINIKSWKFSGGFAPYPPNWGCAPDLDRSTVLYAASLAANMYDTLAKLMFGVGGKNIWGYKKLQGAPKTYKGAKSL